MKNKWFYAFIALVTFMVGVFCTGLTYNAADKATFQNGYAWSGHPAKDRAWDWAVEMQALTEAGVALGTGKIFYVDSEVTTEGNGSSWSRAKDTLDEAVDLCTADRGDVILVAQGHNETMGAAADEVDIDVAGVTIIGHGTGTLRPLFDYTDDTSKAFIINADNVTIKNLVFNANILEVADGLVIEAGSTDCAIIDCAFTVTTTGTDEFLFCIDSEGAASDRLTISGCIFRQGAGNSAVAALHMLDSDGIIFTDNIIQGTYATAPIFAETTASTDVLFARNYIAGPSGDTFNLVAASTGFVSDNTLAITATAAASLDIGNCWNTNNTAILTADVTGAQGSFVSTHELTSVTVSAE